MVKAQVLDVDVEKERISLGIKQLAGRSDGSDAAGELKKGSVVTCEVTEVKEAGIDVKIAGTDLTAFIKRADLARDRAEQRPDRFAGRPEGRCPRHPVRPQDAQGQRLDQGAGSSRREGGDRAVRLVRFGRFARRHSRHRAQAARRRRREGRGQASPEQRLTPIRIRKRSMDPRASCPGVSFRTSLVRKNGVHSGRRSAIRELGDIKETSPCRSMPMPSSIAAACGGS